MSELSGLVSAVYESAEDTLSLTGDAENIDLGGLSNIVSNIETISLNSGNQELTNISLEDVMDMTDNDNTLRIEGTQGDSITLDTNGKDAEWTLGDIKTDNSTGESYQEITGVENDTTVTLEINTEIHIDQN